MMCATAQATVLAQWQASVQQPPRMYRWPLRVAGRVVGSVEPAVALALLSSLEVMGLHLLHLKTHLPSRLGDCSPAACPDDTALDLVETDDKNALFAQLAHALLRLGRCGPWRNECLPVSDNTGQVWAGVERGAVRVLGIRTQAVHVVGLRPDGHVWVQQRSWQKPNDPGLWDTLMGGTVAAGETLSQTLVRETWEEAGLRWADLPPVQGGGGQFIATRPVPDGQDSGYLCEDTHWCTVTVPDAQTPQNQDGEVDHFECWSPAQVHAAMHNHRFTPEARWVLAQVVRC